jgi:hypothetical protein
MSYLAKLASSRTDLVYWVTGKEQGRDCWYYVLVDKPKLELFKAKLKSSYIQLYDYGKIIYSGWGKEPPEEIKRKIEEQFA